MPKPNKDKKNYTMYNETLFEVDRVIQIKWIKNRQYCYIKWKGYDERYNTWQPKEHITFCYSYVSPEKKDDDPEYEENVPINPTSKHQYQTRNKIRPNRTNFRALESEDKEDHTNMSQLPSNHPPSEKQSPDPNSEEIEIRKKDYDNDNVVRTSKDALVSRIINLFPEEGMQSKVGMVEMQNGKIIYMKEAILKVRFPSKVIEYYENKLRQRKQSRD